MQDFTARFESFVKVYSFHFWQIPTQQPQLPPALTRTSSSITPRQEAVHYDRRPYQALYEGYFVEAAAVKAYLALFQTSNKPGPYGMDSLHINRDHLTELVRCRLLHGP